MLFIAPWPDPREAKLSTTGRPIWSFVRPWIGPIIRKTIILFRFLHRQNRHRRRHTTLCAPSRVRWTAIFVSKPTSGSVIDQLAELHNEPHLECRGRCTPESRRRHPERPSALAFLIRPPLRGGEAAILCEWRQDERWPECKTVAVGSHVNTRLGGLSGIWCFGTSPRHCQLT